MTYVIFYSPGNNANNLFLIQKMYSTDFRSVNPFIFSIFNLLGIWPMAFAVLVLEEADLQQFPVWPFIITSFFLGGFIYLIYFTIRIPVLQAKQKNRLQKSIEKRQNMVFLFVIGLTLILYGLVYGDWSNFVNTFWSNGLVHIMSIDFLVCSLIFPLLMRDDMIRRNNYSLNTWILLSISSVLGALIYLKIRLSEKKVNL